MYCYLWYWYIFVALWYRLQFFNFEYLLSGHYIYESKNVRNRGYFSKPNGGCKQKSLESRVKSNFSSVQKGMSKGTFFVSPHQALYLKAYISFIVVSDINIVVLHSVFWHWYVAQRHTQTHNELLCFHCNNVYPKTPHCYVIVHCLYCSY
jgi:hypothetical protein